MLITCIITYAENDGDEDSSYNDPEHFLKEVFNLMFNEGGYFVSEFCLKQL